MAELPEIVPLPAGVYLEVLTVWPERGPDGWEAWLECCVVTQPSGHRDVYRFSLTVRQLAELCDEAQTTALTLLGGAAPVPFDRDDPDNTTRDWGKDEP